MRKYAYAQILGVDTDFVGLAKTAHRAVFEYTPRKGFVYIRSRAISSRTNDNYDTFPADELRKSWRTFIGKPVFVNHKNEDISRKRGVIIDAALHDDKSPDGTDDTWVEVLMEVDAKRFPMLAMALINNDIERTSMGTDVLISKCSYCGNEARTPDQYCPHVKRMKGQRLRRKNEVTGAIEDVLVHEICSGLSFFENSLLVEEPADPTAFTFGLDVRGILEEDEFVDKLAKVASFKIVEAALSLEALVSVAEQTMERAGLAGKSIDVPVAHMPTDPDLVEYNKAIAPLREWVNSIVGRSVNFYASDYKLDSLGGGQAVTDGMNYICVRPHTSEMTVLHECAHMLDGSGEGGHTPSFIREAAELYREYISPAAAAQFLDIVDMDHKMATKTSAVELDELQRARFKGTSVDKDADGYYCKTHRCRSDSYPSPDEIPDSAIEFIESTGAKMKTADQTGTRHEFLPSGCVNQWHMNHDHAECWDEFLKFYGAPAGIGIDEFYDGEWRKTAAIDIGVPTEVRVPPEVETLRSPQCPVCDSDASWNADGRCDVCGYLPPPKPFRAPDTDVAGRADQSGGWFDPELTRATPFNLNPVQSNMPTAKGQRLDQGVSMAQQSVATAARQRIAADRALASENAQLREENARMAAQLAGKTAAKKTADIDNPAQPVTEPAPQAAAPVSDADATVDVESVGGVVAPPDLSVPGNVTTPGAELPASEAPSTDVEAPVAGGSDVQDSTTEVHPNADGDGVTPNAFGGDWINPGAGTIGPTASTASQRATAGRMQAAVRDRIWASVRLARLRIQSGFAQGDDLTLGQEIEKSAVTIEAIHAESSGLAQALRARGNQRQATTRTPTRAPSLAAGAGAQSGIVGLAARGDDEALFE